MTGAIHNVVVGTDLSPAATGAVAWAGALAQDANAELIPVLALDDLGPDTSPNTALELRRSFAKLIDDEVDRLGLSEISRSAVVEFEDPRVLVPKLVAEEDASVLVVGRTGAGGFPGLGFGGTAGHLAHHVECPVVVVPPDVEVGVGLDWVIGVDGSDANRAALEWTVETAEQIGGDVHAAYAYDPLLGPSSPPWLEPDDDVGIEGRSARALVDEMASTRPITFERLDGHRIPAILRAGSRHNTRAIVVGAKGAGSWGGLRLGRVPTQLMLHAEHPVIIVKGTERG